jgi:hypothetical protein
MLEDQRVAFETDGFLHIPSLFSADECAAWRRDIFNSCAEPPPNWNVERLGAGLQFDKLQSQSDEFGYRGANHGAGKGAPPGSFGRLQAGVRYEPQRAGIDPENPHGLLFVQGTNLLGDAWVRLVMDRRIVGVMVGLLGDDVNFHSMKATLKPPGHVTAQGMHQDSFYIHDELPEGNERCPFATCLVYLDETSAGAGATKVAVGSHKNAGGLNGGIWRQDRKRGGYFGGIADSAVDSYEIVQPEMRVGDALVIHAHVTHSVGDNLTDRTRVALAQLYKSARAVDVAPGEGNTRSWAELPAARGGKLAFALAPALADAKL